MSPETSGNPPSIVRRKKNLKKNLNQNGNCFELNSTSHCNYFPDPSHAYYLNLPNVPNCSTTNSHNRQHLMSLSNHSLNCGSCLSNISTFKNHLPDFTEDIEYSSLPAVHMEPDENTMQRRFSDPGLPNDSDSSTNSIEERVLRKLRSRVSSLEESKHRLSKEVMELKIEVNMLKQQSNFKHYDREYEPGIIADVIREVRDAARVREDAFLARVKHLLEEHQQQLSLNHMHFLAEKHKNNDRICKLEEQLKTFSITNHRQEESFSLNGSGSNTGQVMELEREAIELRRELQDTRAKKEASDNKLIQLEKKLSNLIRNSDINTSDASDDTKSASIESLSTSVITNISSSASQSNSRITLTGPVTDL